MENLTAAGRVAAAARSADQSLTRTAAASWSSAVLPVGLTVHDQSDKALSRKLTEGLTRVRGRSVTERLAEEGGEREAAAVSSSALFTFCTLLSSSR